MSGIAVIVNPTKFSDLDKAQARLTDRFAKFGLHVRLRLRPDDR